MPSKQKDTQARRGSERLRRQLLATSIMSEAQEVALGGRANAWRNLRRIARKILL